MKKPFSIVCFVFIVALIQSAQTIPQKEIIGIEKKQDVLSGLMGMNLDFLMEKDNKVYIVAGPEDLFKLRANNIPFTIESQKFYVSDQDSLSIQSGVNGEFHSYGELEQDLMVLSDTYPDLAKVMDIGDSLEGRNIYALKISGNVWAEENEAAVLFLGCHHAREWISVEVPYLLGKFLVENYGTDSEVKHLVDNCAIWIIPLVNPDGLEYSIHFYRYWRKNRRDNGDGTFGIDLNRNYGYEWGHDNLGSSPDPSSETFRGPSPFSEPEVQAVRNFLEQKDIQALVSYHSFAQVILYPWGYTAAPSSQDAVLNGIAEKMSELMETVNGRHYEPERSGASFYLTNGDTTDWSFGTYGIPSYTIELPPDDELKGEFFNPESDIQPIFDENLPAMIYLIEWSINGFASSAKSIWGARRIDGNLLKIK